MSVDSITSKSNQIVERPNSNEVSLRQGWEPASSGSPSPGIDNAVNDGTPTPASTEITKAVSKLNKAAHEKALDLEFSIDSDTKILVVKVVDLNSKEVLRQIPTEEVLEIAKSIDCKLSLIRDTA
ncbi:flagellar protein FlaG [Pseudoduganella sp. RAF53_2]|uniref:flagellar protein FlaG n=1 Tax=unclassified Pseudoduganella TaxID=2637179 RepID=UPI003F96011A